MEGSIKRLEIVKEYYPEVFAPENCHERKYIGETYPKDDDIKGDWIGLLPLLSHFPYSDVQDPTIVDVIKHGECKNLKGVIIVSGDLLWCYIDPEWNAIPF